MHRSTQDTIETRFFIVPPQLSLSLVPDDTIMFFFAQIAIFIIYEFAIIFNIITYNNFLEERSWPITKTSSAAILFDVLVMCLNAVDGC